MKHQALKEQFNRYYANIVMVIIRLTRLVMAQRRTRQRVNWLVRDELVDDCSCRVEKDASSISYPHLFMAAWRQEEETAGQRREGLYVSREKRDGLSFWS